MFSIIIFSAVLGMPPHTPNPYFLLVCDNPGNRPCSQWKCSYFYCLAYTAPNPILRPEINTSTGFFQPTRPQTIHQNSQTIIVARRVINALNSDLYRLSHPFLVVAYKTIQCAYDSMQNTLRLDILRQPNAINHCYAAIRLGVTRKSNLVPAKKLEELIKIVNTTFTIISPIFLSAFPA